MNPEPSVNPEVTAFAASFLRNVHLGRHAEFLASEAEYWRGEALRMKAKLAEIEEHARSGQYQTAGLPPEPPVGTEFFHGDTRVWFRGDLGWYCAKEGCVNCPADWPEVHNFLPVDHTRRLPGGGA